MRTLVAFGHVKVEIDKISKTRKWKIIIFFSITIGDLILFIVKILTNFNQW